MAHHYTRKEQQRIEQYIIINHEYETVTELTESLGIPMSQVYRFCKRLNITPVTRIGLILHYEAGPGRWQNIAEMAESLGIGRDYLQEVLRKNGIAHVKRIRPDAPGVPEVIDISSSPRTGNFKEQYRDGMYHLMLDLDLKFIPVGYRRFRLVPASENQFTRPPAEYDMSVGSDTVKKIYAMRGVNVK